MSRSRRRSTAVGLIALALVLAACARDDSLADQYRAGDNKGYIAGDFQVVEIPAVERTDPVEFHGVVEDGTPVSSDDYRGNVLVVNFWYAACGPCIAEAPLLEEVWQRYEKQGVQFLGVNTYDSAASAIVFAEDNDVTYPSVIDAEDGQVKFAFAQVTPIQATPTTLVLDRDGRVAARIIGQLATASILSTLVEDARGDWIVNPGSAVVDGALWVAIPVAILAGLISFVSPCVLPLVPGYLGYLGSATTPRGATTGGEQQQDPERLRLLLGVALFIAGFTVVFVAVTILGGAFGLVLLQYANVLTRVFGVIIIVLGLVFLGFFGIAQRTFRPRTQGRAGLISAPLLGFALGVGWTPCIGPTLAAIISMSWNLGDPARAGLLGLAYSLGLGIPFLLLAAGWGWATRSVAVLRRHVRALNIVGGALLILLGVLMATGLWTAIMSQMQQLMLSVPLPL